MDDVCSYGLAGMFGGKSHYLKYTGCLDEFGCSVPGG